MTFKIKVTDTMGDNAYLDKKYTAVKSWLTINGIKYDENRTEIKGLEDSWNNLTANLDEMQLYELLKFVEVITGEECNLFI